MDTHRYEQWCCKICLRGDCCLDYRFCCMPWFGVYDLPYQGRGKGPWPPSSNRWPGLGLSTGADPCNSLEANVLSPISTWQLGDELLRQLGLFKLQGIAVWIHKDGICRAGMEGQSACFSSWHGSVWWDLWVSTVRVFHGGLGHRPRDPTVHVRHSILHGNCSTNSSETLDISFLMPNPGPKPDLCRADYYKDAVTAVAILLVPWRILEALRLRP